MLQNLGYFVLHLFLLSDFQFGDLRHRVHTNTGSEHLDFIRVHRSVGNQDAGLLDALRLVQADFLIQKESCRKTPLV